MPTTTITINVRDKRDRDALKLFEGARSWAKSMVTIPGVGPVRAYGIPSRSEPGKLHLTNLKQCSCPDFQFRQGTLPDGSQFKCAHMRAVKWYVEYVHQERRRQEAEAAQEAARMAASTNAPARKVGRARIEAFGSGRRVSAW